MDSITSLIVLIAFVAFISAWTAGGARFNYVGIQMAFSFYLVAFEGFSAPTQLAPARDRFIGILLALGIMWFVFDQLWPVRTVTAMRRSFASVLRLGATLFDSIDSATHHDELIQSSDILRDRIGKTVAGLRQMSDAANYEFGPDRERHVQTSQLILRATLAAAALFWNQLAVLHHEFESDFLAEPGLPEMHRNLAARMDALADSVEQKSHLPGSQGDLQVNPVLLQNPRYGEYTRNIIARYEELRSFTASLRFQV
jgi:multidrug resistance protein MdtO